MNRIKKLRILVVDDHYVVRMGLAGSIDSEPDMAVAGEATNGVEAVDKYHELRPDLVLMDLRLPGIDGVAAIAKIRAEHPDARIIALSIADGDEDVWRAIDAGAWSYLVKTTDRDELLATIRAVASGKRCISDKVAERLAERVSRPSLTEREREVLELIAEGKTNKEIGGRLSIAEVTVKRHVSHLLEKLQAADRTQAVTIAIQHGIVHLD